MCSGNGRGGNQSRKGRYKSLESSSPLTGGAKRKLVRSGQKLQQKFARDS